MPGYFLRRDAAGEREADAIATGAVPSPAPGASRVAAPAALGLGPGSSLEAHERADLERCTGTDLSAIRVHRNSPVPARLGARALAAGRDIALGPDATGRTLSHEVAHSLQQAASGLAIQLDDKSEAERKAKEKKAENAVADGVGVVIKELEKNKDFQKKVVEPAKAEATRVWKGLPAGDQAGLVTFGAVTYGTFLGATLSSPEGRDLVSGLNLALPLTLIPYMPVQGFELNPASGSDAGGFKLTLGADDLLKLAAKETGWFPPMKFSLDLEFQTPADGGAKLKKGKAKFKLYEGIELQVGKGIGLPYQPIFHDPAGGSMRLMQSIPGYPGMEPLTGTGAMITVDFVKLFTVPPRVQEQLGGPQKKQ
ncbi:MAG: DUF4157 domain-containing protein [Sphingomonadaceae bacterium]